MTYNPEIHHRQSFRLKHYDYSGDGAYFVTICTWQRECLLGVIPPTVGAGSKPAQSSQPGSKPALIPSIVLNEFGKQVEFTWYDLPQHNQGIGLDAFVIMPNHVHFVVIIENSSDVAGLERAGLEPAPTLSEIVRQFKTFSAKRINALRANPGCPVWQRNYYERVIRDERELRLIREYIANNPTQWDQDTNHPKNMAYP